MGFQNPILLIFTFLSFMSLVLHYQKHIQVELVYNCDKVVVIINLMLEKSSKSKENKYIYETKNVRTEEHDNVFKKCDMLHHPLSALKFWQDNLDAVPKFFKAGE